MVFFIGTPHTRGAGYFKNDDRDSGGKLKEADVQTCAHCGKVLLMQDWRNDGGWCHRGQHPLCGPCADEAQIKGCVPMMRTIEQWMHAQYSREQFRRVTGD